MCTSWGPAWACVSCLATLAWPQGLPPRPWPASSPASPPSSSFRIRVLGFQFHNIGRHCLRPDFSGCLAKDSFCLNLPLNGPEYVVAGFLERQATTHSEGVRVGAAVPAALPGLTLHANVEAARTGARGFPDTPQHPVLRLLGVQRRRHGAVVSGNVPTLDKAVRSNESGGNFKVSGEEVWSGDGQSDGCMHTRALQLAHLLKM